MADKLKFELVSPERLLISQEVDQVVVPGTDGEFTVLAGHAPMLSTLKPALLTVFDDQTRERIFVRDGFAEVADSTLTVLAETAIFLKDLDPEILANQIQNAQEDVADAQTPEKRRAAQEALDHLQLLQAQL